MDIQGISTTQILTVGIFLVGLIFLQVFITKNKTKFWAWNLFQYSKLLFGLFSPQSFGDKLF